MITKKLLKELQWAAGDDDRGYELSAKEARALLESLEQEWYPEVERGSTKDEAFRFFKQGLEKRFGKKNVRFHRSLEERNELEYEYLVVSISINIDDANEWPDQAIYHLAEKSGVLRDFEATGSGMPIGSWWRDLMFISKRGKKID